MVSGGENFGTGANVQKVKQIKHLTLILGVVASLAIIAAPVAARTRKGDKLFKDAQKAEAEKNWDAALKLYDAALDTDPNDANYLLWNHRIHSKVAEVHLAEGRDLQKEQKLDLALAQFQKAFLADPSNQAALQEIRSVTAMLRERARNPGAPVYTPAERARMDVEKRINSLQGPPTLKPINAEISSLKVNNQPARVLYESVCKLAGINLIVDPAGLDTVGGLPKNYNLDLSNVTLEEALNYVALTTHTFWKPISHNAIFATQEGEQKRQEYQDEVVKVFYIQNASTQNEFTEIFNGVRTGAKLTSNVFQVASQNAIIARGSPDTMSLVEKLVHDLDKPKAEVTMDVVIMEVNKNKASTIGAAITGQGGLSTPFTFTPRNPTPVNNNNNNNGNGSGTGTGTGTSTGTGTTSTTGTSTSSTFTIAQAGHLSSADYSTTLPSTVVQALLSDSSTKVLQRPQLRAVDGGKASLKIGQKIPYVSGSLNSAVATPGSVPYATTQFQQIDIGTLIDLEPHVNGSDDISMHIRVEISNQLTPVNIGGINEPVIGQQIDEAQVRMRDGEVSILGGLSDQEQTRAYAGLPGFTNIPGLNYLFGTKTRNDTNNEVLIVIIPHIARGVDYSDLASTGTYAGTERVPRVDRGPGPVAVSLPSPSTPLQRQPRIPPRVPGPVPPPALLPPPGTPQAGNAPPNPPTAQLQSGTAPPLTEPHQ